MGEIYSLEEAEEFYTEAKAALKKAMHAEGYNTGQNSLQRAKVSELSNECNKWKRIINRLSGGRGGGIPVTGVTPV